MILSNKKCYPSCKSIRDEIQRISGIKLMITDDPALILKKGKKLHMRYGNSLPFSGTDTDYNNSEAIRISSNKQLFEKHAKEFNILVPKLRKFHTVTPQAGDFPIIIRKTLSGKSGEGIVGVFENRDSIPRELQYYWWAHFYKLSWELRVHVFEGQVFRVFSKKLLDNAKHPIRLDKNTHFSLINHRESFGRGKYKGLVSKVNTIYKDVLKANFFVLDCGWCPETKSYLFLESGTAPGLNDNSARMYAERLVERIF